MINIQDTNISPLTVRRILGRKEWGPPDVVDDGFILTRFDHTRSVLVSIYDEYPNDPGVPWVHASISSHPLDAPVPAYEELTLLRAAVWGDDGWAFQVFAPPKENINIRVNALHLWGRLDGTRTHPNFGYLGTI